MRSLIPPNPPRPGPERPLSGGEVIIIVIVAVVAAALTVADLPMLGVLELLGGAVSIGTSAVTQLRTSRSAPVEGI
ncbi:hypothetical protein OG609_42785 [Streptomyces sp. NBC_01224]|uniref:hypothetical protein n=1 Tax=unclassified Streptomyces TaxID=2593676 RepID=UPI002E131315|nr:hypothetical protein OG609_42785 [Streptomyces sp. NBC_01224]